jgi:hypothetical protein
VTQALPVANVGTTWSVQSLNANQAAMPDRFPDPSTEAVNLFKARGRYRLRSSKPVLTSL